ncbi:MAG: PIN domain-containing protein [Propionibacteriaceae bacterium]|nr:PIN domain-containing protein [Propionibacteriaceae bacterium]
MIYIDTSALLRGILVAAPDHAAAASLLADPTQMLISSELLWLEADRAAIRLATENPAFSKLGYEVTAALRSIEQVRLDTPIINAARSIKQIVKSLDAIHIATVQALGSVVEMVVTYDKTMASVMESCGLRVGTA